MPNTHQTNECPKPKGCRKVRQRNENPHSRDAGIGPPPELQPKDDCPQKCRDSEHRSERIKAAKQCLPADSSGADTCEGGKIIHY